MPNTPLNPDALVERIAGIIDSECQSYDAAVRGSDEILYGETTDLPSCAAEKIMALIRPHLAVAQPEVNSVEELDKLPLGAVILDGDPCVLQMVNKSSVVGSEWAIANEKYLYTTGKITLPATVIYAPEVKP